MSAKELFDQWMSFGSDPAVMPLDTYPELPFSASEFAERLAFVMCGGSDYLFANVQTAYQHAILYAAQWHQAKNQKVPGTRLSYVVHLSNVAMEVMQAAAHTPGFDSMLGVQAALLHDVLEDTNCSLSELDYAFNLKVTLAVYALTKPATKNGEKPDPATKRQQMEESLRRIRLSPPEVWAVKMADRITNLQPPPARWSVKKAMTYLDEARVIHAALKEGNEYLQQRLQQKIKEYPGLVEYATEQKRKARQEANKASKGGRLGEQPFWKKHGIKWGPSRAGQSFVIVPMKRSDDNTNA
jgi:guanosine-3',5'-bis(diphosphate) 3'-pyrophosphohydrolase